jgi:uncharacterized protein DUF4336
MVTQLDENIWTYDGPVVVFAGAPMHTRMTVIRLHDGRLWVHSPIELSENVQSFIKSLNGDVAALVAPNKFHYMFIEPWRDAFPHAAVFAEENLIHKVPSLSNAETLTNSPPQVYASDIDQVIFAGNRMFQEAVFFHKDSRTLILTDLMINLKADGLKLLPRLFLRFEGVIYPNGGIPRLYRWFSNDKAKARDALKVIVGWNPQRIVFCHGEPFDVGAKEVIAREFGYIDGAEYSRN